MRIFRLIKEAPDLKAGAVLVHDFADFGSGDYYVCRDKKYLRAGVDDVYYKTKTVENTPEWFEEVVAIYTTPDKARELAKIMGEKVTIKKEKKK